VTEEPKVADETEEVGPEAIEEKKEAGPGATEETEAEPSPEEGEKEQAADELTALRQELEQVKATESEYLDGWQRARAELSNARKRFQREQEQAYANAKAGVFVRLLPIADDFERAFETLPRNLLGLTWIEGIALIQRKLRLLLEQDGVAPIEADGQEFDPLLHQAVTHEPSDTVAVGHVISELQKGYCMGDRVLRPSMVRVSAGPPEVEPVEEETSTEDEVPAQEEASEDKAQA
jgi:molecular chaperone GrpE